MELPAPVTDCHPVIDVLTGPGAPVKPGELERDDLGRGNRQPAQELDELHAVVHELRNLGDLAGGHAVGELVAGVVVGYERQLRDVPAIARVQLAGALILRC